MEDHGALGEADGVAVQADGQTTGLLHAGDEFGDGVDVDVLRQVARQTHDDGGIRVVAFAGPGEGAIDIDLDPGDVTDLAASTQFIHELFGCLHGADSVGRGGANTDFEDIKTLIM